MHTAATSPLMRFRRIAGYALLALAPITFAARAAFAQTPPAPYGAPATQSGDPPGRVARLNYMAGAVTTEPAGASDWSYAAVNRPLTTGDQLWNDANARSELHIGSTAVRLGSSTSLDIMNLDDTNAQLKVAQGTLSTRVREVPNGTSYEIDTPNVALGVMRPGDYRVDVAPDGSTTTVTVRSGALTAYGNNGQVPIEAGQQITFAGTDLQEASVAEAPAPDAFDAWAAHRDAAEDRSISARYVSRDMPGYEDLDANGTWSNDPQYGAVWIPNQEPAGWAPYHDGHWAWVAPWGWTWIDDASWGFAPYHYGRWAYVGSSWCWVPGPRVVSEPPVYAPALVAFVGGGGGGGVSWGVSLTIGGAATAGLAWFPLGPGEVWHPGWGGWSPRYYQRVNQTVIVNNNVTNITNINNIHNTYINYHAPGAVTAVPATAFVHGQPVAHFAQHVDPRQWQHARINPGAAGVAPVRQSFASGLRPAAYRPPQTLAARPVVATRAPAMPAVYRDPLAQHLAQAGGRVPGAGAPVVRPTGPAPLAAHGPQVAGRDVRIVGTHSPVITPMHGAANAGTHIEQPGARAQQPGAQPHPEASHGGPPRMPAPMEHAQPNNGIPRPPAMNQPAQHGEQAGPRPAPAWTQPHAPITQQHLPMNEQRTQAPPHAEQQARPQQPPQMQTQPRAETPHAQPQPEPRVEQRQAQPQVQPHYEQPRAQPQPQPHYEQPRPQPQPQPHYEQPRPQPQPQPHFEQPRPQPQPQPHFEQPRPQPQPQPHFEQPRPQPQPQPHFEQPRPQPQPQPRPAPAPQREPQHEQQHAAAPSYPGHEHHQG
jgi:hypothetical protein